MGRNRKYTKSELMNSLRDYIFLKGRVPTLSEIKKTRPLIAVYSTYREYFGSWSNALLSIGYVPAIRKRNPPIIVECLQCGKNTKKSFAQVTSGKNCFCSQSCAATYNNKKNPKRKLEGSCKTCDIPINKSSSYCKPCHDYKRSKNIDLLTLKEATYSNQQPSNRYCRIRDRAQTLYRKFAKKCSNCSYDKHVEICHVKAIKDFPPETKIKKINSQENIIFLCKNCHWELDHGLLVIKDPASEPTRIRT